MSEVVPAAETLGAAAPHASSNIRHLCRMEIPGGGQIVIDGKYAYIGHQHRPHGTTILDISDPRRPETLSVLMVNHPSSHSHKVRIVGDLMVVNSEFEPGSGRREEYPDGGFRIYDIKDRSNPKLVSFVKTHGKGVHRFDIDENYAYISTEMEGFVGNILVIYDIRNPSKPVEVSRWWMERQNVAGGEEPHPKRAEHRLHHAMRCGTEMYAGCWMSGISIIDVSDINRPRTLSRFEYEPPCPEPTHTFLRVPHPIVGRRIAVSTEEERARRGSDAGKPHAPLRTWDVSDPSAPKLLYSYYLPESATPYPAANVRFGTHQLREKVDEDNLLYVTWFAGGLRIIDISDPTKPQERGYFIPKPADGLRAPLTNDVFKDNRGLLWVTDKERGLDVIEYLS
ncbi:MAG TPA: RNA polymerase subunit sigma-70 [Candidatus Binatia bacterium]|nr:RNA polymerase subunit sigma-70 [Candidatus Binatia bacterium]